MKPILLIGLNLIVWFFIIRAILLFICDVYDEFIR